jgi:hypothetical protein
LAFDGGPMRKIIRNRICANMYLDSTALALPHEKRNLYTAHEVVQVRPLINKDKIYEHFLTANSWVSHYLPNVPLPNNNIPKKTVGAPYFSMIESLAYNLQHRYMRKRITRETITSHAAFFHPRDTGAQILKKYTQHSNRLQYSHEHKPNHQSS